MGWCYCGALVPQVTLFVGAVLDGEEEVARLLRPFGPVLRTTVVTNPAVSGATCCVAHQPASALAAVMRDTPVVLQGSSDAACLCSSIGVAAAGVRARARLQPSGSLQQHTPSRALVNAWWRWPCTAPPSFKTLPITHASPVGSAARFCCRATASTTRLSSLPPLMPPRLPSRPSTHAPARGAPTRQEARQAPRGACVGTHVWVCAWVFLTEGTCM